MNVPMSVSGLLAELGRYLDDDAPALSLPPAAFTSTELWELERTKVFGRSWILAAHQDELAQPGSYISLTVAGEPILITRDNNGALHAMSPICRHRLMPLVDPDTTGHTDSFTCPYHLWKYGLDGTLIGATYMKRNPAFDPTTCRLPAFQTEQNNGFIYLNMDPTAQPLTPHLNTINNELANYHLNDMKQVATWNETWECNWKIAVQNAHENYHAMGFHPTTVALLTPPGGAMEVRVDTSWVTRLLSPFREPIEPMTLQLTEEQKANMYNACVFPGGSIAAFADTVIWISMVPLSIDRVQVRGGVLMPPALLEDQDLDVLRKEQEDNAAVVNTEDRVGLEAVQRVVGSRFADRGHLSPKEPGVLAFYQNLAHALLAD